MLQIPNLSFAAGGASDSGYTTVSPNFGDFAPTFGPFRGNATGANTGGGSQNMLMLAGIALVAIIALRN